MSSKRRADCEQDSSLDKLRRVAPPPSQPVEVPTSDAFLRVESLLGLSLPADYKNLVQCYGTGSFWEFVWPLSPATLNPNLRLDTRASKIIASLASTREVEPEFPFSFFPSAGGLYPWAVTDNGDTFCWEIRGDANGWHTIVLEGRGFGWTRHQDCPSQFLYRLGTARRPSRLLPESLGKGLKGRGFKQSAG